jgi:hypothetical protein
MTDSTPTSKTPADPERPHLSQNAPPRGQYKGGYVRREHRKTDNGKMVEFLDSPATSEGGAKKRIRMVNGQDKKVGKPTTRVRALVENIASGMTRAAALEAAGLSPTANSGGSESVLTRPYVKDMIAAARARTAEENQITRATVLDGLKEAIDLARIIGDPAVMVAGWREIGKMCGFYEAVKVKVDMSGNAVAFSAKLMQLSDEELLRLAGGETIEGEVVRG